MIAVRLVDSITCSHNMKSNPYRETTSDCDPGKRHFFPGQGLSCPYLIQFPEASRLGSLAIPRARVHRLTYYSSPQRLCLMGFDGHFGCSYIDCLQDCSSINSTKTDVLTKVNANVFRYTPNLRVAFVDGPTFGRQKPIHTLFCKLLPIVDILSVSACKQITKTATQSTTSRRNKV